METLQSLCCLQAFPDQDAILLRMYVVRGPAAEMVFKIFMRKVARFINRGEGGLCILPFAGILAKHRHPSLGWRTSTRALRNLSHPPAEAPPPPLLPLPRRNGLGTQAHWRAHGRARGGGACAGPSK